MADSWKINITAKDNVSGTLNNLTNKFNTFSKGIKMVGGALGAAFAIGKIKDFASECLEAYRVQADAEDKINKALKRRGTYTDKLSQQMKDVASQQQKTGVIGDEASLKAMAKGMELGMSEQDASGLLGILQDTAVATYGITESGEHLEEVYQDVAEGINKGKLAFQKYGIQLTDTEKKEFKAMNAERRRAFVMEKFQKYQGQNADKANTSLGKQQQIMNNLGDAQEKVGQAIDKVWAPLVTWVAPGIEKLCDFISQLVDEANNFQFDSSLVEDFGTVWESVERIATPAIEAIKGTLSGVWGTLTGLIEFLAGVFTGDWNKAWQGLKNIVGGVIDTLGKMLQGLMNTFTQAVAEALGKGKEMAAEQSRLAKLYANGYAVPQVDKEPGKANGTNYFEGGRVIVGEYGPELVDLPRGSVVKTNAQTQRELSGSGTTVNCPVTIQGNVIGNEDFISQIGEAITGKVQLAIANM